MIVTARRSVEFMDLHWAISKGEKKSLPTAKHAQEQILKHPAIVPIKETAKKVATPAPGVK